MSFDKDTRNLLAKTVVACRRRLVEDVTDQLCGVFGLHPDGVVLPLEKLTHLSPDQHAAARRLRDLLEHYTAGAAGKDSDRRKAAYERMVLEISFTALNRLAVLRLCEERRLVVECVRKGTTSAGFQMFERVSGGALGGRYDTYQVFLECLFDELALDLGVLFDRMTSQSAVFPSERCMEDVLAELNKTELTHLWTEDETIGWVYQYFNPTEERKAMREASQAPRNSRELAVRNQFFTPRYVVEFLTDNTLGRIWYEMRKGDTELKEECRYLVRRPNEVFLRPGENAPVGKDDETDLSQEELFKRSVYIEHRPKKDPRDLRILDPSCGSGHFLLYAFDLLERIYEEAWSDHEGPKSEVTGRTIQEDFETLDDLRRETPKLIVEHNLHGIDIDPRAVQIAASVLWLRAQKTWKNLGLKAPERPRIARSNIVTAEPMPGEEDMRREFTAGLKPRVLGQIVDEVFEKMKLAGEAGSLLKIEEEIKDAVAAAGKQWREGPKPEQQLLFPSMDAPRPKQQELRFDVKGINDERFWDQAEDRILDALKDYAEQAENGRAVRRRLFAEDTARGFAFIDLCRKRYDVVLMNPPFGSYPLSADSYLNDDYPTCRGDLYPAFIERWAARASLMGAITNRTGLSLKGLEEWRCVNLLGERSLILLADLGMRVLDALVEAAIYIIGPSTLDTLVAIDCLDVPPETMPLRIAEAVASVRCAHECEGLFIVSKRGFASLPTSPISYSASPSIVHAFNRFPPGERDGLIFRVTSPNYDDFRYLRLRWEVLPADIGRFSRWSPIAKGGEYAPYYADLELLIDWDDRAESFRGFLGSVHRPLAKPACADLFFSGGLTWSERTASRFSPRILPRNAIFSSVGPYCGGLDDEKMLLVLGVIMSAPYQALLEMFLAAGDATSSGAAARHYQVGALRNLPIPDFADNDRIIQEGVRKVVSNLRVRSCGEETTSLFAFPAAIGYGSSFAEASVRAASQMARNFNDILLTTQTIDKLVSSGFGLDLHGITYVTSIFGSHPLDYPQRSELPPLVYELVEQSEEQIIRNAVRSGKTGRFVTVKSYYADRKLELICHILGISPLSILPSYESGCLRPAAVWESVLSVLSYATGCAFGRWDIRIAIDPSLAPKLPDPFDPLPVCPPGMLVGTAGLPAEPNRIVSEEWLRARPDANTLPPEGSVKTLTIPDSNYPLRISWDGVLVDDPGFNNDRPHRDDIVRRVREVFDLFWKDKSHEIEQEACDILGVPDLRDYFRKPAGFFQDHLKRYSKSRRKAPIYWPLSTASGSYTIWLYYHRLNDQTLYMVVNKYVEPKISEVERGTDQIENDLKAASGREATRLIDRLNEARTFLGELRDLREGLLRIAALPYKPDLNDGVIINAAPFHKLFRLRSWAKDTEDCWKKLANGDCDWAHLAYTIWPDRVREVCKKNRSIAIAHGLEDFCETEKLFVRKKNSSRSRGKRTS